ncbi:conserved hypothetical protein [Methanothermobacter sp. MT-2]|nr:conserved hypothetical protein [Methanothermobacter sp. MT-2]HHW04628.1 DUF429 domain-containing protein [Methanothermobacter sp.]
MLIGIDLSAKEKNPTGIAKLKNSKIKTIEVLSDDEILKESVNADIVAFDAPLSLPKGRCCLERGCECSKFGHFRKADLEIRKYGQVLPLTFPYIKMLTYRGVQLKNLLKSLNPKLTIIETHPSTAHKLIKSKLFKFKIKDDISPHEFDASIAAITGHFYLKGEYIILGDPSEGTIILPKPL